ncbi:MAG: D-glycero-beta-D-manno-heptose-7-phosphate kinase [Desulfobulbus sp.]|nr:D-glycero-beta-D-manno-heptose-7-phosphate kinase [Desulfobulbus sp.]
MADQLLDEQLARCADVRVLVIGDIIIDHFLWGTASRISPEAPVPVVNVQREDFLLGGAANVLRNIISLGGKGALCGIVGDDAMGKKVVHLVEQLGGAAEGLVVGMRPTTVKTRVVAQGQQIVRFDREQTGGPSRHSLETLLQYLERHLHTFDAVVVSDYAKGMASEQLMVRLHQLLYTVRSREHRPLPLIVDPKPSNIHRFVGATVITPNHHEAMQIAGLKIEDEQSLMAAARQIRDDIGCKAVLITRGEAGMALLQGDDELVTIPTTAKEVYDVTGAGDTVVATLALGLAAGCSIREAAVLANHAAGIVVGKIGTACVTANELRAAMTVAQL